MQLRELDESRLDCAAALVAERQRQARASGQFDYLPAAMEDRDVARGQVEVALASPGARGLCAYDEGNVAGFAVVTPGNPAPGSLELRFSDPRYLAIPANGHAVAPDADASTVIRDLYGELVRDAASRGYFAHSAHVPASDMRVRDAFVELGFGYKFVLAVAPVRRMEAAPVAGLEVHEASAEDIAVISRLEHELDMYHSQAPILMPVDPETEHGAIEYQRHLLSDARNAHWVGYQGGEPVGMTTFQDPPEWVAPIYRSERMVYLYQGVVSARARTGGVGNAILARAMEWMVDQGFDYCALHYHAANPTGGPFWRKHGFAAAEFGMTRLIDPRLGWAR